MPTLSRCIPAVAPRAARALTFAAATASAMAAQERAARPLTTTAAEFAEPLSAVSTLAELADGRVLLNDSREKRLGVLDFAAGTFTVTAREGAGPLEYRFIASMVRVPGDTVVLWDMGNSRRLIMSPAGAPVRTENTTTRGVMRFGEPVPQVADAQGRWYALFQGMAFKDGHVQVADSLALVRITPSTGRTDTLASVPAVRTPPTERVNGKLRMRAPGFVARNAWGVLPDGRALVVHGAEYVPEIVRPDGSRAKSAPVPYARVPVTASDRAAHLKELEGRMARMGAMAAAEAGGGASSVEVLPPEPWQEHHPAVLSQLIQVDSRGRSWVHAIDRDRTSGERHDLLDAEGRLIDAIRLPKGEKLVGMGKGVLYTTREDGDGLVYLRRYPLP